MVHAVKHDISCIRINNLARMPVPDGDFMVYSKHDYLCVIIDSLEHHPSKEEIERDNYEMMDDDIGEELKTGMSKTEVVKLFGEIDTTQLVLLYDLSLPDAKEKYLLEITFDGQGLKDFKRHRENTGACNAHVGIA